MTHTSVFRQEQIDRQWVALNTLEAVALWLQRQGRPELAEQMLDEFTEAEEDL